MKGHNTIKFNQATMIAAVQMYLDAQFTEKHVVGSVTAFSSSSTYEDRGCFEIQVSEQESSPQTAT